MLFAIRPHRRYPVAWPVTYSAGLFQDQGIVWNLSLSGWRLSGDLPLRIGQTFSMTVMLPNQQSFFMAAVILR